MARFRFPSRIDVIGNGGFGRIDANEYLPFERRNLKFCAYKKYSKKILKISEIYYFLKFLYNLERVNGR